MYENEPTSSTMNSTHNALTLELEKMLGNKNTNLEQTGEITLTEKERALLNTISWLVNPDHVSGAGVFQSGSINELNREKIITSKIKEKFIKGGSAVNLLSVDDLLEHKPRISVVNKILNLSRDTEIGVKDKSGKPRVIIITGFSQSKFLTKNGLEWLIETSEKKDSKDLKDMEARANSGILSTDTPSEILGNTDTLSEILGNIDNAEDREHLASYMFANAFHGNWQALSVRKNSSKENIITITVIPTEALQGMLAYETGTKQPVGNLSDFLLRMREFISNV